METVPSKVFIVPYALSPRFLPTKKREIIIVALSTSVIKRSVGVMLQEHDAEMGCAALPDTTIILNVYI